MATDTGVNRWLIAVVVLSVALVALGAWVIVDKTGSTSGAAQDAAAMIDKFNAATSSNDAEAAAAVLTDDAELWSNGETISGGTTIASHVTTATLHLDRTAAVTTRRGFASTFANIAVPNASVGDAPAMEVFRVKDGKIHRVWLFVLGRSSPFESAAP